MSPLSTSFRIGIRRLDFILSSCSFIFLLTSVLSVHPQTKVEETGLEREPGSESADWLEKPFLPVHSASFRWQIPADQGQGNCENKKLYVKVLENKNILCSWRHY